MCLSNIYYPLMKDRYTEKQFIDFKRPIKYNNREQFKDAQHTKLLDTFRLTYTPSESQIGKADFIKYIQVPCGKCSECLTMAAKSWALRILKECEAHKNNWFITFTYNEDEIESSCPKFINYNTGEFMYSLVKDEISKFNKKLKTYLKRKGLNSEFRYFGVGEYGGETQRPHYHVIYFDLSLDDLVFYKVENGNILYNSPFLSSVWNKGHVVIGEVDIGSACYVARYCDKKKLTSPELKKLAKSLGCQDEFNFMSRRPGIGSNYYEDLKNNILNDCYRTFIRDSSYGLPIYFKKKFQANNETEILDLIEKHSINSINNMISSSLCISDIMDLDEANQLKERYALQGKKKRVL